MAGFSMSATADPRTKKPQAQANPWEVFGPPAPQQALPQAQADPRMAIFEKMFGGQQQQGGGIDWNAIQNIVRKPDVQGDANRSYVPGRGGGGSPWADPLRFRSVAQIQEDQKRYRPSVGIPGRTDAASNPYAFGAIGQNAPQTTPFERMFTPQQLQQGGEGMINSSLPDAQKYQDPNFWQARPDQVSLPRGITMGDGVTNYRRNEQSPELQQEMGQVMQMLRMLGLA